MSGNSFGTIFRITTWGESHGLAVGAIVDGCPSGLLLSEEDIQEELDKRRPGQSRISTQRREEDHVKILSGVFEGKSTGMPISLLVWNKDIDSASYDALRFTPRPGHADYSYQAKYGLRDHRGGGRASARETIGRVAAGAIAKKILSLEGIKIVGYVEELGGIHSAVIPMNLSELKQGIESNAVRCPDIAAAERMMQRIDQVRIEGDSLGGIVVIIAQGVPPGLGEPVFDKLDADLSKALMSIGAVKSVEIGAGIRSSLMRGSEMNDSLTIIGENVAFRSNNAGGILGGISTGQPIICRIAVKPTPSIAKKQMTIDIVSHNEAFIEIKGRHDPAIPPRIVPVAEAMVALVLADHLLRHRATKKNNPEQRE